MRIVDILYRKTDSLVWGVRFADEHDQTLCISNHRLDDVLFRMDPTHQFLIHREKLEVNERLVGVVSGQRGYDDARHFDLQFKIAKAI